MKATLRQFIASKWNQKSPLLLALSGGPDSRLLLEFLVELKEEMHFKLAIAHVDHRWRTTSQSEARILENLAANLNLPFHLKVLNPTLLCGNLESACREERLRFFKQLSKEHGYQAVILGHHADDQSETVLKRLFEGATLANLFALKPETELDGLALWRPLLPFKKKLLLQELEKRSIAAFHDETNDDPKFLRSRFRSHILPYLNKAFGKEISTHLVHLGQEALELNEYLSEKIRPILSKTIVGPFGAMLDLTEGVPAASIEQKHLISSFCRQNNLSISRQAIQEAAKFLANGSSGKFISCGPGMLSVDRQLLFALPQKIPSPNSHQKLALEPGNYLFHGWKVSVKNFIASHEQTSTHWRTAWQGEAKVILPMAETPYHLQFFEEGDHYLSISNLGKWWNNAKVPSFFKRFVPIIGHHDLIIHEFLTGKNRYPSALSNRLLEIHLTYAVQSNS